MQRDEFIQVLSRLTTMDFVKAYNANNPTDYVIEVFIGDDNSRTQIVSVYLQNEDNDVVAYSKIGECPMDSEILFMLLQENMSGYYSRLATTSNGKLVQVYRYPLEELEPLEMALAIDEVARYADLCESKYMGTDNH